LGSDLFRKLDRAGPLHALLPSMVVSKSTMDGLFVETCSQADQGTLGGTGGTYYERWVIL
jgi:hypothetical protein